jgi:undecaprenyl-diphosphatase
VLSTALKYFIDRDRPALVEHRSVVYTSSFPSGHSMLSAVVYLTLGSLLARIMPGRVLKLYFLALAIGLTFLVGVSRVYLGVHWPTDVLAGWTGGLVWALVCWLIARHLQRRGKVETDADVATAEEEEDDAPAMKTKP